MSQRNFQRLIKLEDVSSGDNKDEDIAIDEVETEKSQPKESDDTQVSKSQTSRFANLQNISFDFEPYDQDITILGAKSSGKSYLANILMKGLHGVNVWVYDFNSQFHSSKAIVFHDLTKMLELYDQAAFTMLHGDSPEGIAAMAYPPLLVAMYIPFVEMSDLVQRIAMLGVMACFLVFIFSTMQSMVVGKHTFKKTAVYWCLVAAIVGRYVVSPIENYSHDLLIAALIFLAIRCWANQKEKSGGVAIGVAAACKATPLLFLPFLLLQRRWKTALVMSIVMVIAFFLPNILFPRDTGTWTGYWFSLVLNSLQITDGSHGVVHWSTWNQLNQSISGTVERLFSFPIHPNEDAVDIRIMTLSSQAISIITNSLRIVVLGVLFVALYVPSKQPIVFRRFCEGSLLVCAMLLLSPMSSKAHFFLLLLPGCVMMRFWMWEKKD